MKKFSKVLFIIIIFLILGTKFSYGANGLDSYGLVGYIANWGANFDAFLGRRINNWGREYGYDSWPLDVRI